MKHLKSTFSSDRGRPDAGYRAKRTFASVLFAVLAIVLKSEQGIADGSMIPDSPDLLLGKTARCRFHPLVPPGLLKTFFFLYALERQITEGKKDQQHMPMPTGPASTFMVIQSQLFFQLLVALLNPEPLMEETNHLKGRHVLGHVAEEVPKFGLFVPMSSLDDQPDFFMDASFSVSLSGKDPSGYGLNHQRLVPAIFPDLQMLPVFFLNTLSQLGHLHRQRVRCRQFRIFPGSSWSFLLGIGSRKQRRFQKYQRVRLNADKISLFPLVQSPAKLHYIAVPTVGYHRPMGNAIRFGQINQLQGHLPLLTVMAIFWYV